MCCIGEYLFKGLSFKHIEGKRKHLYISVPARNTKRQDAHKCNSWGNGFSFISVLGIPQLPPQFKTGQSNKEKGDVVWLFKRQPSKMCKSLTSTNCLKHSIMDTCPHQTALQHFHYLRKNSRVWGKSRFMKLKPGYWNTRFTAGYLFILLSGIIYLKWLLINF